VYFEKLIVTELGKKITVLKKNRRYTYLGVKEQKFGEKRFWTRDLGILMHK
jgi:hypothetical protein